MRRLLCVIVLLAAGCGAGPVAEPSAGAFQQVLISDARNVRVDDWRGEGRTLTPSCPVNWSVHKFTLHGGKQEGVDVIEVNNGRMQIAVCPTRGMGILWAKLGDVRLGWDSPVKETVHPNYV